MANHIVLEASGKEDDIFAVKMKIFKNKKEAQNYCELKTKRDRHDERYWVRAEIVKDGESFSFH